ncbi:threonine synthase [Ruminococcus sp. YE71]|uniref:threonine synthase n=1 Tax=unclassified Ruminococcus TaxID=2608920 RepID=UPI00088B6CA4|nr:MULTISPECIES: threonine synthase [unclassified Ruminococcus]SDA23589.1 threonine synthase [Ruminococcus sp. YE78]SFW40096.1 threonine synthase [Ruminococcus sp. YE71]
MDYKSTRNSQVKVTSAQAIAQGISKDGGLFVPETIPQITLDDVKKLGSMNYRERAAFVFAKFLTDFTEAEIAHCVDSAYNTKAFDTDNICELAPLFDGTYMLELWHGPTCAFKDMALQILPYLLTTSTKKLGTDKKVVILVATSGDTGKAALEGFKDVPDTSILVFYPDDGVSAMQKKQMTTQEGGNVGVCAIKGNFDDAQNGVKAIFTNAEIAAELDKNGMMFSSANSINWGRLAPQIIYYISSYAQLVADGKLELGETLNVVVPTGNFGNILAAYYAKHMGVPIGKLICASNSNNVLTDFLTTGVYDRNRAFHATISPSMDILISSNLERLLYMLCGENDATIRDWFGKLASEGKYEVSDDVKKILSEEFAAGCCSDEDTKATIKRIYDKFHYTCDTHTAVAVKVYEDYKAQTGDNTKTIIASTASPYKFSGSVLSAIGENTDAEEFELVDKLAEVSGLKIPASLAALKNKAVRFDKVIAKDEMKEYVFSVLGI